MNKLSAVIITKNEEHNIRKCLDSLHDLANEIIIVDDKSNDQTVSIAKSEYNAKVIINESKGNFDNQRNLGIKAASFQWILQMDADEVVTEEAIRKIKYALDKETDYVAFRLIRKDSIFGHPLNYVGQSSGVKLFRRDKAEYIGEKIHETLKVDGEIGDIDTFILHYNHPSIAETLKRWNFYTDVESEVFLQQNENIEYKSIKYKLTYKSFKLFLRYYIKKKGYKDGVYGLVWSILHTIHPILFWLKVLEKSMLNKKLDVWREDE